MLNLRCHFKQFVVTVALVGLVPMSAQAAETGDFKINEEGFYKEVFQHGMYYEATSYLHLDRLYRKLTGIKRGAKNINIYDEVPNSSFFTNRHGRERLSLDALRAGYKENDGPDMTGKLAVTKGKFDGFHPGFFVKDSRGDKYLIKFDPIDNFEMATAAEVISSRFYHALGYNVPQYTIITVRPDQLIVGEGAQTYDDSGFKKDLTPDMLEEYLLFIPQDESGNYRASASKILKGDYRGYFSFHNRRANDPHDPVDHRDRREIRALQVFASWLNNYDQRDGNTLDMVVEENGERRLKHYLIDFNGSLGSGTAEGKPAMFSHEHMFDYGETLKSFFALGLRQKPWEKREEELGDNLQRSAAIGSLDNHGFDPAKFKTQLPAYAFKDITAADGFWAAKIMMQFSDDDVRAMVAAGEYGNKADETYVADVLIERRNIIAKYWFSVANSLDEFDVVNGRLVFKDLAVEHGFEPAAGTTYEVKVLGRKGSSKKKLAKSTLQEPSLAIDSGWLNQYDQVDVWIRTGRSNTSNLSPYVLVSVNTQGIAGIRHED